MPDSVKLTLAELAEETGSQLIGDPEFTISGVAELDSAESHEAAYFADTRFEEALQSTRAGVVFVDPHVKRPSGRHYLLSDSPAEAFQKLACLISASRHQPQGFTGIHASAVIHETVQLGADVEVGPCAVIERDVVLSNGVRIGAGSYVGPEVHIGANSTIHPNVTLMDRTQIGARVVIHPGAVLGAAGFGYHQDGEGKHQHLEHLGNVIIEDDVEIGANTTIDRARLKSTIVGRGTKIDNLVQIAHNCQLGEDNIVVSQVGLAGSVKTGRWCIIAGRSGVNDHVELADRVVIAACSAVAKSITEPGTYIGLPAIPLKRHHRLLAYFHNLDKMASEFQKMRRAFRKLKLPDDTASEENDKK